jgi:hypothetical protein
METIEKKQNNSFQMTAKRYNLSFFGINPKQDWTVAFLFGLILILTFSALYYFDSQDIKRSIAGDSLVREEKKYFDIEKAKNLVTDFEKRMGRVDQTQ